MNPAIFTLEVGGKPVLSFEAKNLREAWEVCHEHWLREDLSQLRSNGICVWDGKAPLRSRSATEAERAIYREAVKSAASLQDELVLAYLIELDGETV
jgi:hypothetical protein